MAAVLLAAGVSVAEARPGGGHGYSGGGGGGSSRSSGSSGGSSSSSRSGRPATPAEETEIWIFLTVFVVLCGGVVLVVARAMREAPQDQSWSSSTARKATLSSSLETLRAADPGFSLVLFEDFAGALFARAHAARHSEGALDALSPWLSLEARKQLAARRPAGSPVRAAVIGSLRIVEAYPGIRDLKVEVAFEANLVVAAPDGEASHYTRERWTFGRPAGARTRPWKGIRTFGCPACGAPLETGSSNLCAACGRRVDDGRFDWKVDMIFLDGLEERPPVLTGTVEERGTDLPTAFTPGYEGLRDALLRDDPAVTLVALDARLRLIFEELQKAWAARDLSGVRPYVSAGLCQHLDYWVRAYLAQGLRNEVEGAVLERCELVRVVRDAHYDSLTFRIWGSGRDFTVRVDTGEVVGGSRTEDRRYTEYWTLIRGAGVRGAPRMDRRCPACGAAVKVGMEGSCAHCGALVTSGDFDWVLSRIEQDDSYTG